MNYRKPGKLLFTLSLLLILCGCRLYEDEYSGEIFAMDTLISITVWGNEASNAISQSESYLYQIENLFSATREGSEVWKLNHSPNEWVNLSPEVSEVLAYSLEMSQVTGGNFDPTIYPLVTAWGFTLDHQGVPEPEVISQLLPYVDSQRVDLNLPEQKAMVQAGTELDFGAVTKGYAGDKLVEQLRADGYSTALISLGGNIYAMGKKTDGSLWNIGIQNPYGGGAIVSVQVENKAAVTSGGYQRYFTEDGETYWHILDPKTGYPAKTGLASVTIVSDSALYGDCLSTALFVMGAEDAIAYWREHQDFEMVLITESSEIFVSSGLSYNVGSGYVAQVVSP